LRHELFPVDELRPGEVRAAEVDGLSVVVLRTPDGGFRALRGVCPHLGAPLADGALEALVTGDGVGDYELADTVVLRCPWHGFEFDVDSGRCIADPAGFRVRAYRVDVEHGRLVLER
jgi:3-phenylpropionate/trans-cinnamate dioxygenase ferredoxin subunit